MPLVGYWPLNENSSSTAYDRSGQENHGSLNGDVTQGATGILGTTAYDFDGNDDDVEAGATHYGIADGTASSFTIIAWCYWDGSTDTIQGIYQSPSDPSGTPGNPPYGMNLAQSGNDKLSVLIQDLSNNANIVSDPDPFPQNEWVLATATYDGNVARVFVNATEKQATTINVSIYDTTGLSLPRGHTFGSWKRQDNRYWTGRLADVRVYDHALTQQEIQYLYNVAKRGKMITAKKGL